MSTLTSHPADGVNDCTEAAFGVRSLTRTGRTAHDTLTYAFPDVAGMTARDAALELAAHGFRIVNLSREGIDRHGKQIGKAPLLAGGYATATADPDELARRDFPGGIGIRPRPTRYGIPLIVFDTDNGYSTDQLSEMLGGPPTVLTASAPDGGHAGGGHFYIRVFGPDLAMPLGCKTGAWDLDIIDGSTKFVVAPPTSFGGRRYRVAGPLYEVGIEAPMYKFMSELAAAKRQRDAEDAANAAKAAAHRAAMKAAGITDPADAWADDTEWAVLLPDAGWLESGVDACGCPTWMHPWAASSGRSATAHEGGCRHSDAGNLRLWSSNAVGHFNGYETVSKLAFVTHMFHDGDFVAARKALGIERPGLPRLTPRPLTPRGITSTRALTSTRTLMRF